MTAIVWDGRYLAADTGMWRSDLQSTARKLYRLDTDVWCAMAGTFAVTKYALSYFKLAEAKRDNSEERRRAEEIQRQVDGTFDAILVRRSKLWVPGTVGCVCDTEMYENGSFEPINTGSFYAEGAAFQMLFTLLSLGIPAPCAVMHACERHAYVAAPVEYVDTWSPSMELRTAKSMVELPVQFSVGVRDAVRTAD